MDNAHPRLGHIPDHPPAHAHVPFYSSKLPPSKLRDSERARDLEATNATTTTIEIDRRLCRVVSSIQMPSLPAHSRAHIEHLASDAPQMASDGHSQIPPHTRTRNRRKAYLDRHPEYFSASLELADPLLYHRLIRSFQSAAEREAEGRAKGFSASLESRLQLREAKAAAQAATQERPVPGSPLACARGSEGDILAEETGEKPATKAEGQSRWRKLMAWRFLRGDDVDVDYASIDENAAYDEQLEQRQDDEDVYYGGEAASYLIDGQEKDAAEEGTELKGQTGVQDF